MKLKTSDWLIYGSAGLSAILAVVFVYGYVQNRIENAEKNAHVKTITVVEKPKLLSVVVANRDIYRGEKIAVDDLKVLNVPTDGVVVNGVITNPQDAVGHIAYQKIYAGEWLINKKIGTGKDKQKQSVEALLDKGERAIRIPVRADTGLLGILNPGDHIDVISVFQSTDNKRMISRTILQNIPVLSIGQANRMKVSGENSKEDSKDGADSEKTATESMIAVEVDNKQAEQLALAMNVGAIHLMLRNPSDTALVKTKGVNLKVMERGKGRPPKFKPKSKRDVIEVMQGGDVQEVITR
ncbi:Flp pilus assembly protein CpaB [Hydrogenovibrio kuenenii]|uniref:Flp pilus assembly protein CpaB n=1 Tax=Hydrogenovibrio kuenenii TaxID=63658 RepID=UPI000467786F|nr:Flp pilus assembly protein CpaB [Hydrogenovibrio kuenenii]